jgi:predicted polyphosphate/ATP-dependent NAD kinase
MSGWRVLVCGGRDYDDAPRIYSVLDHYNAATGGFEIVIQGEATGADLIAKAWAVTTGVRTADFPADWTTLDGVPCIVKYRRDGTAYNALAGHNRNARMINEGAPNLVIAFPGGRGTRDMIAKAKDSCIPVLEIPRP